MTMFNFLTIIFLPLIIGLVTLKFFTAEVKFSSLLVLGLSLLTGFGIIVYWIFMLGAMGFFLNIVVINTSLLFLFLFLLFFSQEQKIAFSPLANIKKFFAVLSFFDLFLLSLIIFFVSFSIITILFFRPVSSWDAIATVGLKAKILFFERTFAHSTGFPHPSYPLQTPLLMSWIAMNISLWHEYLVKLIFPIYFLSIIFIIYGFLREFIDRRFSLLGVVLLCFSNYVILHSVVAYRDLILMSYNCSAILLIILWMRYQKGALLLLAGLLSGFAAFTKLEGMGYAIIHWVFWFMIVIAENKTFSFRGYFKHWKDFICLAGPPIIITSLFYLFKINYGIALGEHGKTELVFSELLPRIPMIVRSFGRNMFWSMFWNWNWILLGISFVFSFREKKPLFEKWLLVAICLFILADAALFLFTPNYKYLLAGPASEQLLPRLILHFFPLCPILTVLMLYRLLSEWRQNSSEV